MPRIIGSHLSLLRDIARALHLPMVGKLARIPGVIVVFRVTVRYHDGRACDSAATLQRTTNGWTLEVQYRGAFDGKPIRYPMPAERGEAFAVALAGLNFDRMGDSPDMPDYPMVDLWLIERAASTFDHAVLLAPDLAKDPYTRLVNAVRNGLPEVVKRVE